jgi:hypothetical protein
MQYDRRNHYAQACAHEEDIAAVMHAVEVQAFAIHIASHELRV